MADLTDIFGGPWTPPQPSGFIMPEPPELQMASAMLASGIITPPENIIFDGRIHRFNSGTKGKAGFDKPGFYVGFSDGVPAGHFGCWRAGIERPFRADVGRKLTVAEEMANSKRMSEAKKLRDAELVKSREVAADTVAVIWRDAATASADHPYLSRKGIGSHGARVTGDGRLIVPLFNANGELSSLQYVSADGEKKYHPGAATGNCFWSIGTTDYLSLPGKGTAVYLAEGFATAATIHEVTNAAVFVAYSASNLVPVAGILRERYNDLVIVADNDASGVGQRYAEQAAAKYGARVIIPPIAGDANDYAQAGHDLSALLLPKADGWLIPADSFCAQPSPIGWLVKHWLQQNALIMVHGPSGGGKTFVVLDMCLRIATTDLESWHGNKVRHGTVVYLAGEGHHGLRGRIAAWKQHHGAGSIDMYLSKDGCDLNTPEGYQRVRDAIRGGGRNGQTISPSIIVVDTLHRFLSGDENSAQDAKTMLDACAGLMNEFACSVLLVHHTGVAEEAQHRARGSSAWRGALDIEISVVPPKADGEPIQIVQRKSKDAEIAEPIFVSLQSVPITGWVDEDNEQVTSAVIVEAAAPAKAEKSSSLDKHRKMFESAWWASGAEEREGAPYLSKSGLIEYLITHQGMKESSAKVYAKPAASGKPISDLLNGELIKAYEHGWIVTDEMNASVMMMRRAS